MTDNEIIKALECCIESSTVLACADCPLLDTRQCIGKPKTYVSNYIVEQSIDLINRQKAEIEVLQLNVEDYAETIVELEMQGKEQNAEIEKLRKIADNLRIANGEAYNSGFEIGKIIGRKEFVDKLKEKGRYIFPQIYYEAVGLKQRKIYTEEDIENTLKEMAGDNNV